MTDEFSTQAFWDYHDSFHKIDIEEHKDWIISRVAQYGNWEDLLNLGKYYTKKEINKVFNQMSEVEKSRCKTPIFMYN